MTSVEFISQEIERKLRDGIILIGNDIEDKYGKLKVALNVTGRTSQIFDRLENLEEIAEMKLPEVQKLLEESEKENPETLKELRDQARSCEKLVEFIQSMKHIEEQIIILRSEKMTTIDWGNALNACKDYLNTAHQLAEEVKKDGYDMSLPLKNFASEVSERSFQCRYFLSAEYELYMKLPKLSKNKRGTTNISMTLVDVHDVITTEKISQNLTAMRMIGQLNERLENWKSIIVDAFCEAIVESRDGEGVYVIETPVPKNSKFILLPKSKSKNDKSMDVNKVLSSMEEFFKRIADIIGNIVILDASMQKFVSIIGQSIEEPIIKMVLEKVIAIAAPVSESGDADQEYFCSLIDRGEKFVEYMKELGFFSQASKLLYNFDKDTIFVTRRCFAIVSRANSLINENYIDLKFVGSSGEEVQDESSLKNIQEKLKSLQLTDSSTILSKLLAKARDTHFPNLFALQKCAVSKSAVEFAELVRETMKAAMESTDESVREKLAITAQNIVRLYVIQSPRKHAEIFSSIPNMAGVFYNNCYYIAHNIMTMSLEVRDKTTRTLLESLLIDSTIRLRDVAADCLEKTIIRARRDLSVYLQDHTAFEHFPNNYKMMGNTFQAALTGNIPDGESSGIKGQPKLVQSLMACLMYINSIAKTLREIMTEIVYCKAIGSLLSFLLDSIVRHVISTPDIRENDANAMSDIFKNLLTSADLILMYRERGRATEFCGREYFRLNEIVFVLGNRMQDIEMRWFNGKGPLAEHFSRDEIVRLIQALFVDSKQRADTLSRL